MSDGFQFYDIIFFALIAIFVVLRLRAVLGRRTGQGRQRQADMFSRSKETRDAPGRVVHLPERNRDTQNRHADDRFDPVNDAPDGDAVESDSQRAMSDEDTGRTDSGATRESPAVDPIKVGLSQIRAADPEFNDRQFVEGSRMAFEMIVEAFAGGETPVLRPLLGDDVYDEFASVIRDRLAAKRVHETTIVALEKTELVGAELRGNTARISIKFISQQINLTRDDEGEIVEGDPTKIERVTDIWTFSRNTRSNDPNWALVETRAPVE